MINFSNATFIKSATKLSEAPIEDLPEVLIVGKSNVGKSSLINAMCHQKRLAFTSSKPGHTRLLNYYAIDNRFYLVDAPGYGFARGGIDLDALFGEMMTDFFKDNQRLKLVLLLIDSRRELAVNDQEIIDYLSLNHIPFLMI
ncbi:MAG: ribosome biogenesis GTP-binding protein YihA/YsxC, partial [Bacilli bacterium]